MFWGYERKLIFVILCDVQGENTVKDHPEYADILMYSILELFR